MRLGKRLGRRSALDGSDWLLTSRAGDTGVRLLWEALYIPKGD
jgi:hypothetical protein